MSFVIDNASKKKQPNSYFLFKCRKIIEKGEPAIRDVEYRKETE